VPEAEPLPKEREPGDNKVVSEKNVKPHNGTSQDNTAADKAPNEKKDEGEKPKDDKKPAGGFDTTPIPSRASGYTVKFTFHRAENLPMADINSLSSDPYVVSELYTDLPTRHKEDPPLQMRTFTVRKTVNPEWNADWIVANVPASGFRLKCRLYDEDPGDHDDRLGNAHVDVPSLSESWEGFTEKSFKIKKRMGSKRAYLIQAFATGVRQRHSMTGHLVVSVKVLGKTERAEGRVYTAGPMWWTKHYSPILGRIVGKKTPGKGSTEAQDEGKPSTERYKYVAIFWLSAGSTNACQLSSQSISTPWTGSSWAIP
jgi:hypothetical protein